MACWLPQVTLSKGQTREGAFINKSLLTLGSVIGKLSDGNAAHIPFRDSKLTRLLQVPTVRLFCLSVCHMAASGLGSHLPPAMLVVAH